METVIIVIAAVLAVAVVGALAGYLVRNASARRVPPPAEPTAPSAESTAPSVESAGPPATERAAPTVAAAPAPVPLDVPEPSAGRLVRLRGRLARSNSAVGKGLLSLLSRDKLDEATWEEIEDLLLTSDIGVAPTQELVERLRTRVRVLGARTPDELRGLLRDELLAL